MERSLSSLPDTGVCPHPAAWSFQQSSSTYTLAPATINGSSPGQASVSSLLLCSNLLSFQRVPCHFHLMNPVHLLGLAQRPPSAWNLLWLPSSRFKVTPLSSMLPQYFEALMTHHIPSDYISLQIQFFTNSFTQKIFIILPHAGFILGNTFTLEIKTGRKDK